MSTTAGSSTARQPATARKRRAECTYIRTPTSIELAGVLLHYVISGVENRFVIFLPQSAAPTASPSEEAKNVCLAYMINKKTAGANAPAVQNK